MTNAITLTDITRSYGSTRIIAPTSIDVGSGQFVSLLGPSGCSKSTILSMVAGLDHASTGDVTVDGRPAIDFQDHALLPWLTARGNTEFGLRSTRPALSAQERREVGDRHLAAVGIARAFAVEPEILLLDEPFGALDALTRRDLQLELLSLWETDRRTVVMVTHDVDATVIADISVDLPRAGVDPDPELRRHLLDLLHS